MYVCDLVNKFALHLTKSMNEPYTLKQFQTFGIPRFNDIPSKGTLQLGKVCSST